MSRTAQAAAAIRHTGIVVIIRGHFAFDDLLGIVETLVENRLDVVEMTLNSSDALTAIDKLRSRFAGRAHIGAGTVRSVQDAQQAIAVGAEFLISPCFSPDVVRVAGQHDTLILPGVMTPSEAQRALEAGCTMQKLFPAEAVGGPAYLKAIRAPLDDIEFVPTGGVSEANIAAYKRAGAAAVAVGSTLVAPNDHALPDVARRAAACFALWHRDV